MPIIKSAIKRVRSSLTKRKRNVNVKNRYKAYIKDFLALIADKKIPEATKLFSALQKSIDMAVKKNILPANNAARKKSRYSKLIEAHKATRIEFKVSEKSSSTKKAAPKKAVSKKPVAKKAPASTAKKETKKKTAKK